jgi:hypothetical protein
LVVPEDRAVEDQDAPGSQGGADPVGDDHQRATRRIGLLGPPFGLRVEVAGGFVQDRAGVAVRRAVGDLSRLDVW